MSNDISRATTERLLITPPEGSRERRKVLCEDCNEPLVLDEPTPALGLAQVSCGCEETPTFEIEVEND